MRIGFEIKGLASLGKKLERLKAETLSKQIESVQESVLLIHETAIKKIQDNSDGTPTVRYNPKRTVNVSFPGDPPNTDKGRLVQSIQFDFKNNGLVGRVGTNLKYGAWLEFGTLKMQAHPWLGPSVREVLLAIGKIFAKNISKGIKESAR